MDRGSDYFLLFDGAQVKRSLVYISDVNMAKLGYISGRDGGLSAQRRLF